MAHKKFAPRRCLNPICGIEYIPSAAAQKYCCEGCRPQSYESQKPVTKKIKCPECGNEFSPSRKRHTYCSAACSDAAYRKANYNTRPKPAEPKPEKIKPGTRAWKNASPYRRMYSMSLSEVQAECLKKGITYKEAQIMYYNNQLPDDFGKTLKRTE